MRSSIIFLFLALSFGRLAAQNYDIRLQRTSLNCTTKEVCFDVQLRRNGGSSFGLAGQNYRIFYDASLAAYVSGTSLLPTSYGAYTLVQDMQDVNAGSINGPLAFESTLGFLNYSIDLNDIQNGGVFLPSDGSWLSTSNLCFIVENQVFDNQNTCLDVVWGRNGLTDLYSTAFIEVSRWLGSNNTTNSMGVLYDDLNSNDGEAACLNNSCNSLSVSVNNKSVFENAGNVYVDVCLSTISSETSTVVLNTSNGTAFAGLDYSAVVNHSIIFLPGVMCIPVLIPILDDDMYEGSEVFNVILSNPSTNVSINNGNGTVTILENECPCAAQAPMISGN